MQQRRFQEPGYAPPFLPQNFNFNPPPTPLFLRHQDFFSHHNISVPPNGRFDGYGQVGVQGRVILGSFPPNLRPQNGFPLLELEQALQIGVENNEPRVVITDIGIPLSPSIYDDQRSFNSAVRIPQRHYNFFQEVQTFTLHCSFLAMNCTSCSDVGENHGIGGLNLFLITDQFGPARVGTGGRCIPTIRAQDPSFNLYRGILLAQQNAGFNPPPLVQSS